MTTFYIVRHGESQANVDRIIQGYSIDTPLTEKGRNQAEELALSLQDKHFDMIFSSNSQRAKETAEIIGKKLNLVVTTSSQIREREFGKYEGMNVDEFLSLYKDFNSLTNQEKFEYQLDENEESNLSGVKRLINFLEATAKDNPNKTILVVSHSGIIRSFLIYCGFGDFDSVGGIVNTGYIQVEADQNTFNIKDTKGLKTWSEERTRHDKLDAINTVK